MFKALQFQRVDSLVYHLTIALFATHELDAVARAEWQLLPVLSSLNDEAGLVWFVLLHIPLFWLVFWLGNHTQFGLRNRARLVFCSLTIVHTAAHFLLSGHSAYQFEAPVETVTVYGSGVAALIYVIGQIAGRSQRRL